MNIPLLKKLHKAHCKDAIVKYRFDGFANWIHNFPNERTYETDKGYIKTIQYEVKPCTR